MTVSTTSSSIVAAGNGVATQFSFPFIGVLAADISVIYTDANGTQTTLSPTQYTLALNAPAPGQIWGVGGTVTYTISGSPIASGTTLTILRTLPLTQATSISNQGDFYPQVVETALDTLCMEMQQVAARTGQLRGTWATGDFYNYGDMVVDGVNGAYTNNIYLCVNSNTSGTWATDLAAGYWSLVLNVQNLNFLIGNFLPISGGTITGNLTVDGTTTLVGATSLAAATGVTKAPGSNTTDLATTAFVTNAVSTAVGSPVRSVKLQTFTSNGTYTPSTGMLYAQCVLLGGGGAGGGAPTTAGGQIAVGGGGGAGQESFKLLTAAQVGASQTVTVGAGGTAVSGGTGNTGGTTSIGSLATAVGGTGGTAGTAGATSLGGVGSGGSGGTSDIASVGQYGTIGMGLSTAYFIGGRGGNTRYGAGGAEQANGSAAGSAGQGYGSGGAGATQTASQGATVAGGAGKSGVVLIVEYCSV